LPNTGGNICILFQMFRRPLGPTQSPIRWNSAVSSRRRQGGRDVRLTAQLHLMPRLTKSGAIPLAPSIRFHGVDKDMSAFCQQYLLHDTNSGHSVSTSLSSPMSLTCVAVSR